MQGCPRAPSWFSTSDEPGTQPLMVCAERLAQSLARAFAAEIDSLDLPLPSLPLEG